MPRIEWAQATDIGTIRQTNQDAVLSMCFTNMSDGTWQNVGLFIVADGMGGRGDGEKAAAIAVHTTSRILFNRVLKPLLNSGTCPPIEAEIVVAVQAANTEIIQDVPEGGSTITLAIVVDDIAYIGHVGDSRAYLVTRDSIKQLTRVHDMVHRLVELGQVTWEEAIRNPIRNVLYRAVGIDEPLEVDAVMCGLASNTSVLLCSDGLTRWWFDSQGWEEKIKEIIVNARSSQQACEELITFSYATHDTADNISAIVIKIV
ncbi:MAG: serine/threonine-protein phosphatase [Anaerolineae bacterium]|nr:serine/threonine-protein phosphatase [Anaerolineae bacterium]